MKTLTIAGVALSIAVAPSAFQAVSASSVDDPAEVPLLNLSIGNAEIADGFDGPQRYGLEYRARPLTKWKLIPAVGFGYSNARATFVYAELKRDFRMTNRWVLTPSFGVGYFNESEDLYLGLPIEFRSGIELAYRFSSQYRLGAALFHLSNGGLSVRNPGTEVLVVSLSIPIGGS